MYLGMQITTRWLQRRSQSHEGNMLARVLSFHEALIADCLVDWTFQPASQLFSVSVNQRSNQSPNVHVRAWEALAKSRPDECRKWFAGHYPGTHCID